MLKLLVAMFVCATSAVMYAQEPTDTLVSREHVLRQVEIDERMRHRALRSSSPVQVLSREQFDAQGVTDLTDAIRRLPGISLRDYGGAGGMKTVSVRGFGAKHTGVSYDGVLLSDCQSGEIDVARYSLDNVAHVSLQVGDNDDIFIPARNVSAAALLTIQTLALPTDDLGAHLTTQVRTGSFGQFNPFVRYEQNFSNRFAFSAVGEYSYAENDYPFTLHNLTLVTHERRTNSRMSAGHGELNALWTINRRNWLGGKVYYYDNSRQLPGQVRYYTSVSHERLHDRNAFGQLQYNTTNQRNLSFRWLAKYNWSASLYQDGPIGGGISELDYRQHEAYTSASLMYRPSEQWAMSYAADYFYNTLNSNAWNETRPLRHSILQSAAIKYGSERLTAMLRVLGSIYINDTHDGDNGRDFRHLSPSLSASWKVLPEQELYVRASYKNIFRVPTFTENYYYHFGNPLLSPEKTDQWNVGVTFRHHYGEGSEVQLACDAYLNHVKDKIVAVPYNMFIWTNINLGRVQTIGVDATLNATHRLTASHALMAAANYSYQRAENRTLRSSPYYGNQLPYMPEHSGSASIAYENPWLNLCVHATAVGRRYANPEHLKDTSLDSYSDWGVAAYRTFNIGRSQRLDARFDLKNMFNRQYEIVRHYPMPGRSWQCTVRYQF